jgi:hypothetical protein
MRYVAEVNVKCCHTCPSGRLSVRVGQLPLLSGKVFFCETSVIAVLQKRVKGIQIAFSIGQKKK